MVRAGGSVTILLVILILGVGCASTPDLGKIQTVDAYDYVNPSDRCSPRSPEESCALTGHYVLIHRDGYALTPDGKLSFPDEKGVTARAFENQLNRIAEGMRWHAENLATRGCGDTLRVLLFVHGGLNGFSQSVDRMIKWMSSDGVIAGSCYYPIFINWDSSMMSSIYDDIVGLRFGQRPHRWYEHVYSWLSAPIVLTSRLVSAIGSLPIAMGHSLYNVGGGVAAAWNEKDLSRESAEGQRAWVVADVGLYSTLLPFQLITTPLLEGLGTPAWHIMKRRANLAVAARLPRDDGEIFESWAAEVKKQQSDQKPRGGGAAWVLLNRLRREISDLQARHREDGNKPDVCGGDARWS